MFFILSFVCLSIIETPSLTVITIILIRNEVYFVKEKKLFYYYFSFGSLLFPSFVLFNTSIAKQLSSGENSQNIKIWLESFFPFIEEEKKSCFGIDFFWIEESFDKRQTSAVIRTARVNEKEGKRERPRQKQRERQRHTETYRETNRDRESKRERQTDKEERERRRERASQRET